MKKLFTMVCMLALCACGGGTTGGMSARNSNLMITSSIDNETRRTAHITKSLGARYYDEVRNRDGTIISCGNEQVCNDVAFENMRYWLIDNIDNVEHGIIDEEELRQALIVAGFEPQISNNMAETRQWVHNNKNMVRNQATEIYNELGTHHNFDVTRSDFSVLNGIDFNTTAPSKIKFHVDGNGKITNITFHDSVGSCGGLDYPGVRKKDTTWFRVDGDAHIYKLDNVASEYYGIYPLWNHYIEVKSSQGLDLAGMKAKMIQYADDELAKGADGFFGTFPTGTPQEIYDATIAQINNLNSLDEVSYEFWHLGMDFDLQSFGKHVGLAYSDFGRMMIPNPTYQNAHMVYHGGYEDKLVSDAHMNEIAVNPETDMNFKGRAIGKVENKMFRDYTDMDINAIKFAGNATINFKGAPNGATETMHMEFPDWYDVTITKTPDGNNITFANYTNDDAQFKFYRPNEGFLDEHSVNNFTEPGYGTGALQINYYAENPNWNPSEASGYTSYGENTASPYEDYAFRSVEFQSTFGTIRDYEKPDNK